MRILKRLIALLLLILVLVAGVLFSIQNTVLVPLDLLIVQLSEQRVAIWVLLAFAMGGLVGLGISTYAILHLKGESLLLRRKLNRRNKELDKLRSQNPHLPATKN